MFILFIFVYHSAAKNRVDEIQVILYRRVAATKYKTYLYPCMLYSLLLGLRPAEENEVANQWISAWYNYQEVTPKTI